MTPEQEAQIIFQINAQWVLDMIKQYGEPDLDPIMVAVMRTDVSDGEGAYNLCAQEVDETPEQLAELQRRLAEALPWRFVPLVLPADIDADPPNARWLKREK